VILTKLAGVDQITLGQSQKGKGTRISLGGFASASHYLRQPCEEQRGLEPPKRCRIMDLKRTGSHFFHSQRSIIMVITPWSYALSAISTVGEEPIIAKRLICPGSLCCGESRSGRSRGIKLQLDPAGPQLCALGAQLPVQPGCTNARLSSLPQSRTNTNRGWRAVFARTHARRI
jgi:hypothetical protein